MNSKEAIKMFEDCAECEGWDFFEEIDAIKKDLDRLEKLEKVVDILKQDITIERYENRGYIINNGIEELIVDYSYWCYPTPSINLTECEYNLLKEVLEDEKC